MASQPLRLRDLAADARRPAHQGTSASHRYAPPARGDREAAARELVDKIRRVKYNVFTNNCHLFSASCIRGDFAEGKSLDEWLRNGMFSIDRLESVISKDGRLRQ